MKNNENIFDDLWKDSKLPPKAKEEFLKNIEALKTVADFVDLFTIKGAKTGGEILGVLASGKKIK